MNPSPRTTLEQEWCVLQNQTDSYEKHSLLIKLVSVVLCSLLLFHQQLDFLIVLLCGLCALLDGIWKTFQSRIDERLLEIELAIINQQFDQGMQYHTRWQAKRGGVVALLMGYIKSLLTPTVALPHGLTIGIAAWIALLV